MKKVGMIVLPMIGLFLAYYYWKISSDKKAAPKTADALPEKIVEEKIKEIANSGLVPQAPPKKNPTHIKIAPAITPNPVVKPTPVVKPDPVIKPAVQPSIIDEERLIRNYGLASSPTIKLAYEPTVLRSSGSVIRDSSGVIDRSRAIIAMR